MMRNKGRWIAGALAVTMALLPELLHACPVCYGEPNSPLTKGVDNAVFFLLGIVGLVQVGFVGLFVSFWLRARALARRREQFRVIDGGLN